MVEFIRTQYYLYKTGGNSIGIEKITKLANAFMTKEQISELFEGGTTE